MNGEVHIVHVDSPSGVTTLRVTYAADGTLEIETLKCEGKPGWTNTDYRQDGTMRQPIVLPMEPLLLAHGVDASEVPNLTKLDEELNAANAPRR